MLNLKHLIVKNIFLSHCSLMVVNPIIIDSMKDIFDVNMIKTPKEDLSLIIGTSQE